MLSFPVEYAEDSQRHVNLGFYQMNSVKMCACQVHFSSAGHLQVGTLYGHYPTGCRRMSRLFLLLVKYLLIVDLTVIVDSQKYRTKNMTWGQIQGVINLVITFPILGRGNFCY